MSPVYHGVMSYLRPFLHRHVRHCIRKVKFEDDT